MENSFCTDYNNNAEMQGGVAMPQDHTVEELAAEVLALAHSRLTADLRFLSASLERLHPVPLFDLTTVMATDGHYLYYAPAELLRVFHADQHHPVRV